MTRDVDAFPELGACRFSAILQASDVARIGALFGTDRRPGKRLSRHALRGIADLIRNSGPIGGVAGELLGAPAQPVRALLLDKSDAANWSLGWHQDRTIAVKERIDLPGFDAWSVKAGQLHVQPPHHITARMITLRVHVDAVDAHNAPLQIIPASHRLGRLDNSAIEKLASEGKSLTCFADPGDIWAYATAIVHASAARSSAGRRRVLQVDYSPDDLPSGLQWASLL